MRKAHPALPEVRCPCCNKCFFQGIYLIIDKICDRCGHRLRHKLAVENFEEIAALLTSVANAVPFVETLRP